MMRVGGWISVLGFTAVTLWTVRDHPSNSLEYGATSGHSFPKEPRRRSSLFSSSMGWLIGILIVIAPISIQMKLISAGVLLLLTLIPPFAGQWTLHAAQEGDFDRALQRAKLTSWLPGFPKIVIGTVLLDAGRYPEAHDFLKPLAIDAMGRPRVECSELYLYALSLSNAGEEETAQQLLEAAAHAAPPSGPVKFPIGAVQVALACCLLSQNKEPERAERIIEQALLVDQSASTKACRLAVHAWAEASCGHANEAKAELERAFECVPEGDRRTQAAVLYAAGDMWLALGELSKARTAFESVQSLRNGDLAIRARRKLSQLENVR
jgi:tetratricopeptide (TPR) repeat protein